MAGRAVDHKPCRERKGGETGGSDQKGFTRIIGNVVRGNISQPHWTYAIRAVTWNTRITQRIAYEKE